GRDRDLGRPERGGVATNLPARPGARGGRLRPMSRVSSDALAESLLRAEPIAPERRPASRWAYPLGAMLLVSAFVLYHTAVLLIWNLPGKSIAEPFHRGFLQKTRGIDYFKAT